MGNTFLHCRLFAVMLLLAGGTTGCGIGVTGGADSTDQADDGAGAPGPQEVPGDGLNGGADDATDRDPPVWSLAFDASAVGALSGVWGDAPDDVFVVGGTPDQGEVYHYDGSDWRAMKVPSVPLLVWVYGFAADDVYAVGVGGGMIHFDGTAWTALDSGTTEDLWGVWGRTPNDIWIVGGNVGGGDPVILHFDGATVTSVPAPPNDRNATSLFKVWGIASKVFAVGERGLILQFDNNEWFQVPSGAGANEDFVSLWGTSEDHIVAVGGRTGARIAVYDGTRWTTHAPSGVPGLNAVCMFEPDEAVVGGVNGFVGAYNPFTNTLTAEPSPTGLAVHAAWADGSGRCYAVGGRFAVPYTGVALVRTFGDPGFSPTAPRDVPADCTTDNDCSPGRVCVDSTCLPAPGCDGADDDSDGWLNSCDNCVSVANVDQADGDSDGVGDACDRCPGADDRIDADDDGVPDACDVCPGANDTADADADGVPDACDACPGSDDGVDSDADGVADGCDACPGGNDAEDADGDTVPDACDACPNADDRLDADADGVPDACDRCPGFDDALDADGDGVADGCDACPGFDDSADADADGVPDACDVCAGSDDTFDSDNDGVPNGCDVCPGFADDEDADADGVPNGCDLCTGRDTDDSDGDGVPDACDVCSGFDDGADADSDGVPDGCDQCPGFIDAQDADGDGVPDGCDRCAGHSDTVDVDADGVPDGCDPCPRDALDDSDSDGVCDSADVCPGSPDGQDADDDGVPDGCDICPGADDRLDLDRDGVPDGCDACPGSDDKLDADGDTVPDGCDSCRGFDDLADGDADGVPDGCDACPGFDDRVDRDFNGIPDGCCKSEPDCPLGESCVSGICQPSTPDIELGQGDPFNRILEGGDLLVIPGFQGFGDIFLSYRTLGYTSDGTATITLDVTLIDDGTRVAGDAPSFALSHPFTEVSADVNVGVNDGWLIAQNPFPLFGRRANVTLTITDDTDPSITVTLQQTVVLVNANDPH